MDAINPINYSTDVKAPFEQAIGGFQVGQALGDQQLKRQDLAMQRQAQLALQTRLAEISNKERNGSATPSDYIQLMTERPDLADHFKAPLAAKTDQQKQSDLSIATQVMAGLGSGKPDAAISVLREQAAARRNSGDEAGAKASEAIAATIEKDPSTIKVPTTLLLLANGGADKLIANWDTIHKVGREETLAPSALAKSEADARKAKADATVAELEAGNTPQAISLKNQNTQAGVTKIYSDIRSTADRLALDKDRLRTETELEIYKLRQKADELPEYASKEVNSAATAAVAARQTSQKMIDLATKFEKLNPDGGVPGRVREGWKTVLGTENDVTAIRNEFNRIKNMEMLKYLPPGSTTEKEAAIVQKGFPTDTFNATEIADFLRVMAKLSQVESVTNSAKAEWVNYNHSLGNAKRDIVIDGVRVPAGSTFADFSSQFLKRKAELMGAEQSLGQAQKLGRGYLRFMDGTTP